MTNHLNHIQNLLSRFHAFENQPPNPMQFRPTLMGRITSSRNSEIMRFSILLKLFHLLAGSQQFLLHRNTITKNYHCLLHHPLNVGIHQSASVVRCPLSVVRCPLSLVRRRLSNTPKLRPRMGLELELELEIGSGDETMDHQSH